MEDMGLISAADHTNQPIEYTYKTEQTLIDHALVNPIKFPKITTKIEKEGLILQQN